MTFAKTIARLIAVSTCLASGCTTLPPSQASSPNPVTSIAFHGPIEDAFEIARNALMVNGVSPRRGSPDLGYVSGEHGASAWSWGEIVAIYFKEEEPGRVLIWVVSKPKLATNITAPDWSGNLLAAVQSEIRRYERQRGEDRTPVSPPESGAKTGTGFVITSNGLIATAYHVVESATNISVRMSDGKWFPAYIAKQSRSTDIALLKIDSATPNYLSFAEPQGISQGEKVFTMGFPISGLLGDDVKYTEGVISALSGLQGEDSLMQITVPVQPGNSGGPLLDNDGRIVGLITSSAAVTAFFRVTGTFPQSINWAVKAQYIQLLAPSSNESSKEKPLGTAIEESKTAVVFIKSE